MNSENGTTGQGSRGYVALVCIVAALGGLLFGYDTAVINGAIGFMENHFHLGPTMTGWAASSALVGCVIGVSFAGWFSDRLGRKKALILAGVLFLGSSIGTAVPEALNWVIFFRILAGVGVGVASMASPMYIAEISPARMRGQLVSVNQLAIVSGILGVYFVNLFIAKIGDEAWRNAYAWRWMFASGVVPSGLFLLLLFLVPESPRWLVEKGRKEEALRILSKVAGPQYAKVEMAAINESLSQETSSLAQLFTPGMLLVLFLGIALATLQQVTGINVIFYYGTEIFKAVGSSVDTALLQTVAMGAVNLAFTVVAIWTVDRFGRKPLMIIGSAGMGMCLAATGIAFQVGSVSAWLLIFILGYVACFALSVGPVTWVLLSEIFPTKVRGRALSMATFCLWTSNFFVSWTFPMMDKNPLLVDKFHHGFPFYVYAAFCVVLVLVV